MIRKNGSFNLYLLRHAEAFKNLAKVHGGGDQRLTPTGENQARALGHLLQDLIADDGSLKVIHQPEGRSKSTAQHIGSIAVGQIMEIDDLVGVKLGVAGGLSEEELEKQYPEVAVALADWRNKKGNLNARPHVPGSEHMEEFAERILRGVLSSIELCEPSESLAIVGTTSTLNMMNHLLTNDGDYVRSSYDFIEYPLASFATWRISPERPLQIAPTVQVGEFA